jgi:hypothetical protein
MSDGGKREGAGRPKGSKNKATLEQQAEIAATGETPLDYMIRVMRDKTVDHDRRDKMAAAAAPYVHAKLAAIEHTGKNGGAIETTNVSDRDMARAVLSLLRDGARGIEE